MKFDHVAPLQGWSRHLGHSWSRKEYPGGPEKCWHITCFEPEIFFWKMRGMFSQLLTKKATWQKSTSVPILVMQCSISEIVSTRRSWLHLDVMEFFLFLCDSVLSWTCPPIKCGSAGCWLFFSLTRTAVVCVWALNVPTLSKVVFVCQNL